MSRRIGREEPTPPNFNDRRFYPRLQRSGTALMRRADDPLGPAVTVIVENISHGGVSVTFKGEVQIGDRIILEIKPQDEKAEPLSLKAKVRWIASNKVTGLDSVGCDWIEPLTLDELLRVS